MILKTDLEGAQQCDSLFNMIHLPRNCELGVYSCDYYIDENGQRFYEMSHERAYEYGDLVFETSNTRYILKKGYPAYNHCASTIQQIECHVSDEVIPIDLDKLNESRNSQAEDGFEVQPKEPLIQ